MKTSIALKGLLGAGALTLPLMAFAESNVQTGAATASPGATAHVDFSIVIPKILYLRVGTGSTYASGTLTSANTIDLITFSPAAGTVGNGTPVAGTGGDLTGGVETAAIVSNSGNVTLNATASGALSDGNGDYKYDSENEFFRSKLVDNFNIEHKQLRGYFLNGRGQRQQTANLAKDDDVWVVQEFEGGSQGIKTVRIVITVAGIQLRGPMQ